MLHYLYRLNFPNGKKYFGITDNPNRRSIGHRSQSKTGRPFLVNAAIRKYGMPPLQILCAGSEDYIKDLEVRAIEEFQTYKYEAGYNLDLGRHRSTPETRAKISAALMGHPGAFTGRHHLPETLAKMSASNRGQKRSAETRAKMSTKAKSRPPRVKTAAECAKLSATLKGRRFSPEHRAKMSAAAKQRLPHSLETRAKLRTASTGRVFSTETRAKISAAKKGKPTAARGVPKSPEHRRKLIAAMIRNGLIPYAR